MPTVRNSMFAMIAMACFCGGTADGGYLAILDSESTNGVRVYDTNAHAFINTWVPDGLISDIAIDPGTGLMYAASQGGVYSRALTGGPTTSLGIYGFPYNSNGDIEVFGNYIAFHASDTSPYVDVYDTTTHSFINYWAPDGAISDITIDPATGLMYAASQGGIYSRAPAGGPTTYVGGYGFPYNAGSDIEIWGKYAVLHHNDSSPYIDVYDMTLHAFVDSWAPDGAISDFAIDRSTGLIYAATQGGIYTRAVTGGPTTGLGIAFFSTFAGGDIEFYSAPSASVPEPSSIALLGSGILGLCGYRARRRLGSSSM